MAQEQDIGILYALRAGMSYAAQLIRPIIGYKDVISSISNCIREKELRIIVLKQQLSQKELADNIRQNYSSELRRLNLSKGRLKRDLAWQEKMLPLKSIPNLLVAKQIATALKNFVGDRLTSEQWQDCDILLYYLSRNYVVGIEKAEIRRQKFSESSRTYKSDRSAGSAAVYKEIGLGCPNCGKALNKQLQRLVKIIDNTSIAVPAKFLTDDYAGFQRVILQDRLLSKQPSVDDLRIALSLFMDSGSRELSCWLQRCKDLQEEFGD